MSSLLVEAKHIYKSVVTSSGELPILTDVSCKVSAGESVAIIGASGSGKTTLLSILAGLETASSGECFVYGQDLCKLTENARASARKGKVGFVFQAFHLLPNLTALENIALPLELTGDSNATRKAKHWLQAVGLAERGHHRPAELSGGEQQRVAIARACSPEPGVIFADEPTGNLDDDTSEKILELIFSINQRGKTSLVLVTHNSLIAERCDKVYCLQRGQLFERTL